MDPFYRGELKRLLGAGVANHASWQLIKRRLRALSEGWRAGKQPGAPTKDETEAFLEEHREWYEMNVAIALRGLD